MAVYWDRLVRFVAQEDDQIHIGEPTDPELDGACFNSRADFKLS